MLIANGGYKPEQGFNAKKNFLFQKNKTTEISTEFQHKSTSGFRAVKDRALQIV